MVRGGWNLFFTIFCMCAVGNQCKYLVQVCRHNIDHYKVTVDEQLSPIAQKEIEQFIQNNNYKTVADALDGIQKQCYYLQKIEACAYPNGRIEIKAEGSQPHLIINTEYLLTANGTVTYSNHYKKNSDLPRLYYPGRNPINAPELIEKISKTISPEILKQYEVTLFAEEDIRLTPLENPNTTIRCCLKNFPNKDLLLQSCSICSQELEQLEHGSVIADLRFKNQIVVSKKG